MHRFRKAVFNWRVKNYAPTLIRRHKDIPAKID
jgi:hypothetical protein